MRILVLNGPNLNLLGERDPDYYGSKTLDEIISMLVRKASILDVEMTCYQSNHEGDLIDKIHEQRMVCQGMIINPGALTHYSYSIRDALEAVGLPFVEVHLSNIQVREDWRSKSVISDLAWRVIMGKGADGYIEALTELVAFLRAGAES